MWATQISVCVKAARFSFEGVGEDVVNDPSGGNQLAVEGSWENRRVYALRTKFERSNIKAGSILTVFDSHRVLCP